MFQINSLTVPVRLKAALQLEAGACVVLSGPSGSGKSRFLRALADLDPNDGEMSLGGLSRGDFTASDWRLRVTYVAAESGWWAERVGDHFHQSHRAAAIKLMIALGLPESAMDWEVMRLSSGERQRLAIVRALVQKPDVLLLDEPTGPLDKKSTAKVEQLLLDDLARGVIVLLVTHDLEQAARLGTRFLDVLELTIWETSS